MSIFVSIASYRDRELIPTVDSLFKNADFPNEINLAIFDQDDTNKINYFNNVNYQFIHFNGALGVGHARNILFNEYNGEDFILQLDSHMRFVKGWDTKLINMIKMAQELSGNEKIILSHAPLSYHPIGYSDISVNEEIYQFDDEHSRGLKVFYGDKRWYTKTFSVSKKSHPIPSQGIMAGCLFSLGSIVNEVPYDARISFHGEEICYAIRSYTRGWDIYAPNVDVIRHFYNRDWDAKIWYDNKNWDQIEKRSQEVVRNVLCAIESGTYGIENTQRYEDYQKIIGINFKEQYGVDST